MILNLVPSYKIKMFWLLKLKYNISMNLSNSMNIGSIIMNCDIGDQKNVSKNTYFNFASKPGLKTTSK